MIKITIPVEIVVFRFEIPPFSSHILYLSSISGKIYNKKKYV